MNESKISPKLKAAIILTLCLCLVASGLIGAAIAKYISSITGSSSTDVAVWSIEVNDQQVASSETQTFTFDLYDTLYEEDLSTPETHVSAGVIAPGTGGAFTLKVENLSQVDAEFTLILTEGNEKNIPIQYSTDRTTWHDDLSSLRYLFTDFFLERETGVASKTIYWRWCYTGSGTSHLGQTDDSDTALGFLALTEDVKLTITADLTVGQYVPRPEAPAQDLLAAAEITDTSITLHTIEGAEYSMDGITWQDSPTFTGLTSGTEYTLYVRYKETDNDLASKSSSIKLNTTITYTDFVVTAENRAKVGYVTGTGMDELDLVIPETFYDEEDGKWYKVVGIDDYAFMECWNLDSVSIPNSVVSIGAYAFAYDGLSSVTISEGVITIGEGAFDGVSSLTTITIPNSVTTIGAGAFGECSGLAEITFGSEITSIGSGAFYVFCDPDDPGAPTEPIPTTIHGGNSVVYEYDWAGDYRDVEFADVEYTDFTVTQENRDKIGYNSYSTSDLNISATFYDEEDGVWYKVTAIGDYAFYEGSLHGSLTIPEGVTRIGAGAFESCGITSVYIPNSVTIIDEAAFYNTGLTDVYYSGSETSWEGISIHVGDDMYNNAPLLNATIHYNYTAE